jgi:hypothetical protein
VQAEDSPKATEEEDVYPRFLLSMCVCVSVVVCVYARVVVVVVVVVE